MKSIKLLVTGFESSGKSTMTSQIKDALVINFDQKEYSFSVPHSNFRDYLGINSVTDFITEKVKAYKEKTKELPKVVVLDTVTQLYSAMTNFNSKKYTGFNIHSQNNSDTLDLNNYIEKSLVANGISVVIVAHTLIDPESGRFIIPAQGSFAKAGSFLSIVNDSIFIEKASGKLVIYTKSMKYPARTTLKDYPEKIMESDYDINEHISKLMASKVEATKYIL